MRRSVFVVALMGLLISASTLLAVDYTTYSGFITSEEPVLPKEEVHPCLWFTRDQIGAIVAKKDADAHAAKLWKWVWEDIEAFKREPIPSIPTDRSSKDISRYYGTSSRAAKYLAFAWITTGDTAARDKAVEILLRAYDGPIFELDPTVSSSVVDEIYRGAWLQNYCTAYDWVAESLTPEQHKAIRARLIPEARLTYAKVHIWGPRPHNHLSKPAWGLGTLALTMSAEPEAAAWLRKALHETNRNTRYFFSADGIYREGSHYLLYSWVNFLPFLYHYKNVSGVNNFPVYQPAFEWMLNVRNGRGFLPNVEDAYIKPTPLHMVAKEYMTTPAALHPTAKLGNLFQWAGRNSDYGAWSSPPFLMGDGGYAYRINANSYSGQSVDDTWNLDEYLTYDPAIEPVAPVASGTVFMDRGGQTIFRNNWTYRDPSHRYLLFHGVAEADNHFHYDHLSFIIQGCDQMMASDGGYSTGSYSDAVRKNWFMTAPAHNVITANGLEPRDAAENVTPVSRYNLDTQVFDFQEKEAPYKGGAVLKRAIGFPGQDYFVVADSLANAKTSTYELYLHGGRGRMSGEGNHRLWTYRDDNYGRAAKMAAWILPAGAAFENAEGDVTYIKGDSVTFPYVKATVKAAETQFMQILIPLLPEEAVPALTDLSGQGVLAARVVKGAATDTFLLQPAGRTGKAGPLAAAATFAWVREQGGLKAWMVREGTEAALGNALLFKSSAPVTMVADLDAANRLTLTLAAKQPACTLSLPLPAGARLGQALFDGKEIKTVTAGDLVQVEVPGAGELVLEFAR
ncbi:MAG: heparinase II/III family protein [Bacteroidota bacterium]